MQDKARFFFERQQDKSFRVGVKDSGRYIRSDDDSDSFLSTRYQNRDPYCRFYLEPVYWNEEGNQNHSCRREIEDFSGRHYLWTATHGDRDGRHVEGFRSNIWIAHLHSYIPGFLHSVFSWALWFITEKLMVIAPAVRAFTKGSFVLMYLIPITGAPLLYTFEIIVQLSVMPYLRGYLAFYGAY